MRYQWPNWSGLKEVHAMPELLSSDMRLDSQNLALSCSLNPRQPQYERVYAKYSI